MREKHFILNKKGIKLAAIIERPDKLGRFPGVILLHGFTGYKEEEQYTALAKSLIEKDIASIRFDASGFGESGGTLEYDYRFSNYISDTENVYDWFRQQEYIDSNHIGVMGQSLGGYQSLIIGANHPEIKCVVSVSSPNIFYRKGESTLKDQKIEDWEKTGFLVRQSSRFGALKIPYDFYLDANPYNAIDYAIRIKSPKLIIYGTEDVNVPPAETQLIYDVSPEPKQLVVMDWMDHYYKRNPEFLEKMTKICTEFIVKNI